MKTEKIIWGLILVFIGGILLLQNFGIIDFYWHVLFRFWPLILILIGANLLFSQKDSIAGAIVSVVLTLAALGFIAYNGITTEETDDSHWSYNFDDHNDDHDRYNDGIDRKSTFSEVYKPDIKKAVLNISGGATEYILNDSTTQLFDADVRNGFGNYSLSSTSGDSSSALNFKMKGKSNWKPGNHRSNQANLRLNTNPIWDINIEMGAGTARFDLTPYKIQNLRIEGGAAAFEIKMGQPLAITTVSVETGVSDIDISIPSSAACKINTDSGLSSNDFEGFTKNEDGTFTTSNYKDTKNSIIIKLEGGLSKFKVKRY